MRRFWTFSLAALLSLALIAGLTGVSIAKKGGNGGGGGNDPPPPDPLPVLYRIQYFDMPVPNVSHWFNDMNNLGESVGDYRPFDPDRSQSRGWLYDPEANAGQAIDLNDLVDPATLPADGFVIWQAMGINDWGDIVAALQHPDDPTGVRRGCIIDRNATDELGDPLPPQLYEIPDAQFGSYTYPRRINLSGEVAGTFDRGDGTWGAYLYRPGLYGQAIEGPTELTDPDGVPLVLERRYIEINDHTQVAGQLPHGALFRYTPGGDWSAYQEWPISWTDETGDHVATHLCDLSNSGVLFGRQIITYPKRRKGAARAIVPFLLDNEYYTPPYLDNTLDYSPSDPCTINDSGDFLTSRLLYQNGVGWLRPDDLIDPTDPNAGTFVGRPAGLRKMNNRVDPTGFGQISGTISLANGQDVAFLLTPILPPPAE